MDLSTMIVDMLRGSKEEEVLNMGGPLAKPSKLPAPTHVSTDVMAEGGRQLANPEYQLYKREALANGEPVMTPEEFAQIQGKGSY